MRGSPSVAIGPERFMLRANQGKSLLVTVTRRRCPGRNAWCTGHNPTSVWYLQRVGQPIAQQAEGQAGEHDGDAGERAGPPLGVDESAALLHAAPAVSGRSDDAHDAGIAIHLQQLAVVNHGRSPTDAYDGRDAILAGDDGAVTEH